MLLSSVVDSHFDDSGLFKTILDLTLTRLGGLTGSYWSSLADWVLTEAHFPDHFPAHW